jgi:hypothetical protein
MNKSTNDQSTACSHIDPRGPGNKPVQQTNWIKLVNGLDWIKLILHHDTASNILQQSTFAFADRINDLPHTIIKCVR